MATELPPHSETFENIAGPAYAAMQGFVRRLDTALPEPPGSPVVASSPESALATQGNFTPLVSAPKKCAGAVRRTGLPCRTYATHQSDYCLFHDPTRQKANREASRRGGANRAINIQARLLDLDLHDRAGIQALIAQVIRLELLGLLAPRRAAALQNLLRLLVANARAMDNAPTDPTYDDDSGTLISLTGLVSERMAYRDRVDNTVPLAIHAAQRDIDVRAEAQIRQLRRKPSVRAFRPLAPRPDSPPPAA